MNTSVSTRDQLWAGVHTAVDDQAPGDLPGGSSNSTHNKLRVMDHPVDMDLDAPAASSDQGATPVSTDKILADIGASNNHTEQLDVQAPPGAASLVFQPKPDGNVALPPAGAAMADADDPGEDDVDLLQPNDYEYDDDVSAVGGDILGVGPTYGTVAGDPTSNLGRLGPDLVSDLLAKQPDDTANQGSRAVKPGAAAGDSIAVRFSEGDADVRGAVPSAVSEDADLSLRPAAASAAGVTVGTYAVATGAAGAGGGIEGGMVGYNTETEYGPEGFDALEPGGIDVGGFRPQLYIRHRSAGQARVDPDPRLRPDPDPRKGLGLEDAEGTGHPVEKGDFAMGTIAVPAFGADAGAVNALEYTDEPKYAKEVEAGTVGDEDNGELVGNNDDTTAAAVDDVSRVGGSSSIEGSGPVLLQNVGEQQLQQAGVAAATAAQPSLATDARHLGAIFGENPYGA